MIDENERMGIDLSEPSEPLDADGLYRELKVGVQCDNVDWLLDAVVTAVTTDDLAFLVRQCEAHVTGWKKP